MADREDDVFKALADGHRRRILNALCRGPLVAGDLGRLVALAPNAVSFHLKMLRSAGLVRVRREGRCLRYHANPDVLARWRGVVEKLFTPGPATPAATGGYQRSRTTSWRKPPR